MNNIYTQIKLILTQIQQYQFVADNKCRFLVHENNIILYDIGMWFLCHGKVTIDLIATKLQLLNYIYRNS